MLAERRAKLRDRHVARIFLIGVEGRSIGKVDHEPCVVGTWRAHDVFANLQVDHAVQVFQSLQALAVLCALRAVGAGLVFEADKVHEHQSSSPSISSSATSTTTLWMSMRNQSRNVFRSRVAGQVDSSSVHAAS